MPPRQMVVKMCGSYGGKAVKTTLYDSEVDALFGLLHGTVDIDPCDGCGLVGADECGTDCPYPKPVRNAWIDARVKLLDLAHIADGTDKASSTTKPDYPDARLRPTKAVEDIAQRVGWIAENMTWEYGPPQADAKQVQGCLLGKEYLEDVLVLQALLPIVEAHLRKLETGFRAYHGYPPILTIPME